MIIINNIGKPIVVMFSTILSQYYFVYDLVYYCIKLANNNWDFVLWYAKHVNKDLTIHKKLSKI